MQLNDDAEIIPTSRLDLVILHLEPRFKTDYYKAECFIWCHLLACHLRPLGNRLI